ncbi:hypothetical protein AAMO2058_001624800 [Amorphochlora amoebiformis]
MVKCTLDSCTVVDPEKPTKFRNLDWDSVFSLSYDAAKNLRAGDQALSLWDNNWDNTINQSSCGKWTTTYYTVEVARRSPGATIIKFKGFERLPRTVPDRVNIEELGSVPGVTILRAPIGHDSKRLEASIRLANRKQTADNSSSDSEDDVPIASRPLSRPASATITPRTRPFELKVSRILRGNTGGDCVKIVLKKMKPGASASRPSSRPKIALLGRVNQEPDAQLSTPLVKLEPPDLSSVQPFEPNPSQASAPLRQRGVPGGGERVRGRMGGAEYDFPLVGGSLVDGKEIKRLLGPLTEEDKGKPPLGLSEEEKRKTGFVSALGAWHYWDRVKRLPSKSTEDAQLVVAAYVLS